MQVVHIWKVKFLTLRFKTEHNFHYWGGLNGQALSVTDNQWTHFFFLAGTSFHVFLSLKTGVHWRPASIAFREL